MNEDSPQPSVGATFDAPDHPFAGGSEPALREAEMIVRVVQGDGETARLLGGAAIALRCEHARPGEVLGRAYSDLDIVVGPRSARGFERSVQARGYLADAQFNALQGARRMIFEHPDHGHVDVFVGEFAMCHRLRLDQRLDFHPLTVTPADLLLTKLQVAEITAKDLVDVLALLLDQELSDGEDGINVQYVADLLARDWGWWRTVTANLHVVETRVGSFGLAEGQSALIRSRIERLRATVDGTSRSTKWKIRARAGDRLPWREEPEDARE